MPEEQAQMAKINTGPRTNRRTKARCLLAVVFSLVQVTTLISTSSTSNIEAVIFSHSPIISNNIGLNFTFC